MQLITKGFDPGKIKVFIEQPLASEKDMFSQYGYKVTNVIDEADLLVWTGGGDINPALYNERPLQYTHFYQARDERELRMWRNAGNKFKAGICRGGQLLNVLNGGRLWQHVTNHGRQHPIEDMFTGKKLMTSSLHHQAFRPAEDAVVVATTRQSGAKFSEKESWKMPVLKAEEPRTHKEKLYHEETGTDYEVLWYPKTRSLCFQGHPEFGPDECTDYFFELLSRYYGPTGSEAAA